MDTVHTILGVFVGEHMIRQPEVNGRRVDLYFPDYNIAVECDEYNHRYRDQVDEVERSTMISNCLGCHWVRYDPNPDAFDMITVLGKIYALISGSKMKTMMQLQQSKHLPGGQE